MSSDPLNDPQAPRARDVESLLTGLPGPRRVVEVAAAACDGADGTPATGASEPETGAGSA